MFRKKIIKSIFWTGFSLVLFLSVVAIVRVGNAGVGAAVQEQPVEDQEQKVNLAAGVGAQTFAGNFATDYFHWENTDEAIKERAERLTNYVANGLDEQAGLSFEGMEWNSKLTISQVWNVEETGEDTALITLRVMHELKKVTPPDPKEVEQAKIDKKDPPEAKEEKAGPYEKYFVVPVKTDGQSFAVHEIPYFAAAPKKPDITAEASVNEEGKVNDSELQEEVKTFMNTFFKVYTTGTEEELSYYMEDDQVPSMNGVMTFEEVKNIIVKEGHDESDYKVHATVIFTENQSKAQVIYPYQLNVTKKENRWIVKNFKNQ